LGIEVHHIQPQADGGTDDEDNAAALCPSCHETYGANPQKRKFIREARDFWYELCAQRYATEADRLDEISQTISDVATKSDLNAAVQSIGRLLSKVVEYPNEHLRSMLADIARLKSQLSSRPHAVEELASALDDMSGRIVTLGHAFRRSLQGHFVDFGYLKLLIERGQLDEARYAIVEIAAGIEQIQRGLAPASVRASDLSEPDSVSTSLSGCRLLIAEDDLSLAKRLADCFRNHGAEEVHTAGCINEVIRELSDVSVEYDLLILDMVLPETEAERTQYEMLNVELSSIREMLQSHERDSGNIQDERAPDGELLLRRSDALAEMQSLLNREGGFLVLERWGRNASSGAMLPPVLFLTAVGKPEAVDKGRELTAGRCEWLLKPVPVDTLVRIAGALIRGQRE